MTSGREPWDASLAARLPGKLLFVGLIYLEAYGKLMARETPRASPVK